MEGVILVTHDEEVLDGFVHSTDRFLLIFSLEGGKDNILRAGKYVVHKALVSFANLI